MMVLYKPLKISTKLKLLRVAFQSNERRREIDKLASKHSSTVNKVFAVLRQLEAKSFKDETYDIFTIFHHKLCVVDY